MPSIVCRALTKPVMAEAVLTCLTYARANPEKFTFGPLQMDLLQQGGLRVSGDIDKLKTRLVAITDLTVEDQT